MNVLLNLVIDRSSSMLLHKSSTIEGINQFLDEQRTQDGQTLVSMTLFSTGNPEVRYVAEDIANVTTFGEEDNHYFPSGATALYDAVGVTVEGTEQWLSNHPGFDGKVVTCIMTDGEENSSTEWHLDPKASASDERDVNQLVARKLAQDWDFVFLGAGQDAWAESTKWSNIPQAANVNYATSDQSLAYAGLSQAISNSRASGISFNDSIAEDSTLKGIRKDPKHGRSK